MDDVTLEVSQGGICGIYGRNGSGKSLLLHCIFNLNKPTSGTVEIERKARPVLALQKSSLAPELTLVENLAFFASIGRVPARRRTNRIAHVMQDLGLIPYRNVRAGSLSAGVAAKAEIARVLVAESSLVIIDGLLDYLDETAVEQVWRVILSRRREEGQAFLITTTKADNAARCDFVTMLHQGRVLAEGKPSELLAVSKVDTIVIDGVRNPLIKSKIRKKFAVTIEEVKGALKFSSADSTNTIIDLLAEYGSEVGAVYIRQPRLDDLLNDLIEGSAGDA